MANHDISQTHCCNHYPDRVLQRSDLAPVLGGVCEKTVNNLVRAGNGFRIRQQGL
jgi:hypothetical protein